MPIRTFPSHTPAISDQSTPATQAKIHKINLTKTQLTQLIKFLEKNHQENLLTILKKIKTEPSKRKIYPMSSLNLRDRAYRYIEGIYSTNKALSKITSRL